MVRLLWFFENCMWKNLKSATYSIETSSEENNGLVDEPNKIWRDFVKKIKEETNRSKNYHKKFEMKSSIQELWIIQLLTHVSKSMILFYKIKVISSLL